MMQRKTSLNTGTAPRSNLIPIVNKLKSRPVLCGRLLFITCLCATAAALGVLAHRFLTKGERELAVSQFESIAERALTEAHGNTRRKRLALATMASMVSEIHPNASDWPFVYVDGFERIVNNLLDSTSGKDMGFTPFVKTEDLSAWEDFAYDYYYNIRSFPNTTAQSSFGRGVWGLDYRLNTTDKRFHASAGGSGWGSPNDFIAPIFHVAEGVSQNLLFNLHEEPSIGRQIDGIIECSDRLAAAGELEPDRRCGAVTDMFPRPSFPASRGPGAAMYQAIYPANDKSTVAGLATSMIVWDEILNNIFSDEVRGVEAVLATATSGHTYTTENGIVRSRGEGALHHTGYDEFRRCRVLTGDELYADSTPGYELCLYPTEEFFDVYTTSNPNAATIGSVLIILFTSMLFLLYDFFVRREFTANKDLLEAKRLFMRFVSHEVRTPLNSVCLGLTVIQTEIAASLGYGSAEDLELQTDEAEKLARTAPDHEDVAKSLEWFSLAHEVRTNAQSAVDVLSDLLNYDKIENGELNLELTPIRVWRMIERTANEFKLPASEKRLQFDINFSDLCQGDVEEPIAFGSLANSLSDDVLNRKLVGDEVRLIQVLRNLLSNAIKFTPAHGSISLTASWLRASKDEEKNFQLKNGDTVSFRRSGQLQVSVHDAGAGMTEEQLQKVFHQGVQFNVNELQAGKGSGLGLYIAKGIVQQHEGTLVATSEGLGKGATFTLTLPLYYAPEVMTEISDRSEDELEKSSTASRDAPSDGSTALRILVVDDVSSNRKLLGRLLKNRGHDVGQAENGQIALDMVAKSIQEETPYDSVLMDYEMPVMNGPTSAKEIRSLGSDVLIVGITGNLLPEDIAYFQSCGANAVLPKPLRMASLEELWTEFGVTK